MEYECFEFQPEFWRDVLIGGILAFLMGYVTAALTERMKESRHK